MYNVANKRTLLGVAMAMLLFHAEERIPTLNAPKR